LNFKHWPSWGFGGNTRLNYQHTSSVHPDVFAPDADVD
jgi:hypothetical protein